MIHLLLSAAIFLSPSDPRLNERADEVCPCHICSDEIQQMIEQMIEIGKDLSAPQIGIEKRMIFVGKVVYIDPEILWKSDEVSFWFEECASTPRICGIVPRAQRILMRAYDREGNVATREFEGLAARAIQHEIDHLDGIRFPDRIADLDWVDENELLAYRAHWKNWQQKYPKEKWLEIKNGPAH